MRFATLEGRLVSTGGMVVKNVTGLDMAKLMIGSYGTLAVIASANFKIFPRPESSVTFRFRASSIETLLAIRNAILQGVLQPVAVDWLDPRAAASAGCGESHALLVEASGNVAATKRFEQAFKDLALGEGAEIERPEAAIWEEVRETVPQWLAAHPHGAAIRASTVSTRLGELIRLAGDAGCGVTLRAANATGHLLAPDLETARLALGKLREQGFRATLEAASNEVKGGLNAWVVGDREFEVMQRIKADFDPLQLLNRGRLYGAI